MQDTDRTLYVLCGIPYSGKSTFADKDPVLSGLPKLSSDRLILEKAERLGTTYDKIFLESIKEAEKEFLRQVNGHLEAGQSFVIDRTNGNPKSRMKLCRKAKEHGFRAVCIYFEHPSTEEIEERIGERAISCRNTGSSLSGIVLSCQRLMRGLMLILWSGSRHRKNPFDNRIYPQDQPCKSLLSPVISP